MRLTPCTDITCVTAAGATLTEVTNVDGNYGFGGLEVGFYLVEIVLATVDGDATTPSKFIVSLASLENFDDADFGIEEVLPVTGLDTDRPAGSLGQTPP